jgi:hypothetical protein
LTATVTDNTGRVFNHSANINIYNNVPSISTASAAPTRTISNGKFLVNLSVSGVDPDGDAITYEFSATIRTGTMPLVHMLFE